MKWFWLRALILGLSIGPAGVSAEPDDVDPADGLRRSAGYVVRGPQFLVWDEDQREADAWAAELSRVEGTPLELAQWRSIAARTAALPPVLTDEIEAEVATWDAATPSDRGITPLGCLLCLIPSLDRTALISSWATSPDDHTRRAVAGALAAPFEAIGVRAAIEQLQDDPSPEIRRLAASAASGRNAWSA